MNSLSIKIINQLKDNYSYIILKKNHSSAIIIDPAESASHIDFLKKNNFILENIIITHHHSDHTNGVEELKKEYQDAKVYSPSELLNIETTKIIEGDTINTSLNKFSIIETPGHTLDHVVLYDSENKVLFSGDTLFRLGCGRIFEGTFNQMYNSLQKIYLLPNNISVYCGHEYTLTNLKFLESILGEKKKLKKIKNQIKLELLNYKRSIPFNLGLEKELNPFLNQDSELFKTIKNNNGFSNYELFKFLRDKKDSF